MSQTLELPDPLYTALERAADASGTTPVGWIAAKLQAEDGDQPADVAGAKSLADLFKGRVGMIRSGGTERLSEDCDAKFTDHLQQQRRAGHL